jgi:peptidoglycan/xylan/chitin deacetylase (PgdA/CDA1 family)
MMNVLGEVLWRIPGRFNIISLLGPGYSLRCVLFHHICDRPSVFTDGMSVTIRRNEFEARIRFLAQHYTPIDLETFLHGAQGEKLPRRPVLVTFDDAYASVAEEAAPICRKYRVPALFFVNAAFLGNRDLSMDNFLAYVANTFGLTEINAVAREFNGPQQPILRSRKQVTSEFIPTLSAERLQAFKRQLAAAVGADIEQLANAVRLYLSLEQLRGLASSGFEIGNHTFSHVHCRILAGADFRNEIENNKSVLESILGREVRAFSLPYGSVADFTPSLEEHLKSSGHKAAFLVESRTNTHATNPYHLNRVSVHSASDAALFGEIEVLPRLRAIRDSFLGTRKRGLDPALPGLPR